MASFLSPVLREPAVQWQLRDNRTGATLADHIECAFDSDARRRGLLGRSCLDQGSALVIAPSNAIHTFFMKFPIDVLFVRKAGNVVKCRGDLGAWRVAAAFGAYAVIELPAGTLRRCGTVPGDVVELFR